jgi:hypothetical protein
MFRKNNKKILRHVLFRIRVKILIVASGVAEKFGLSVSLPPRNIPNFVIFNMLVSNYGKHNMGNDKYDFSFSPSFSVELYLIPPPLKYLVKTQKCFSANSARNKIFAMDKSIRSFI